MAKNLAEVLSSLLRDIETHADSYRSDDDISGELWTRLYKGMEDAKCLDYDYAQHTEPIGGIENVSDKIGEMSFKECCTWLTWILRGERLCDGLFSTHLNNGNILALLKRVLNLIREKEVA